MTRLSSAEIDHVVWLYHQGFSYAEIAMGVHASRTTVAKVLKDRGVVARGTKAPVHHPWRAGAGYLAERGELVLRRRDLA